MDFEEAKMLLKSVRSKQEEINKLKNRVKELRELISLCGGGKSSAKASITPKKGYVQGIDYALAAYMDNINEAEKSLSLLLEEVYKMHYAIARMPTFMYQKLLLNKYFNLVPTYQQEYIGNPSYSLDKAIKEFADNYKEDIEVNNDTINELIVENYLKNAKID